MSYDLLSFGYYITKNTKSRSREFATDYPNHGDPAIKLKLDVLHKYKLKFNLVKLYL